MRTTEGLSMPALAAALPRHAERLVRLASSRWTWCVVAVLFVVLREIGPGLDDLRRSLGDTDDATRLIQVREFMAGAGWWNLTLPRVGFTEPLVSHWSRLIDAPIAILLWVFGLVMSAEAAELAVRIVWPSLLLVVFIRLLVREAEIRAGQVGALVFMVMAITCLSGLFQFRMGRIDHHNAMILGTVAGLLALVRAFDRPAVGYGAGALMGLGLAVGYEPLALTLPMLAVAALAVAFRMQWLDGLRNALVAMAGVLAAALVLTTPPWRLATVACDALALNMVLLVSTGALTCEILARHGRTRPLWQRLAILGAGGLVAGLAYLSAGPVCIGGPFAMVSLEAKRLWLADVSETQTLFSAVTANPTPMIVFAIFAVAGIAAAAATWRAEPTPANLAMLVLVAGSLLPAVWQTKFIPYASWLAAFALALRIAALKETANMSALSTRLIAIMALNQSTLALVVAPLLLMAGTAKDVVNGKAVLGAEDCRTTSAITALAKLPTGKMANEIDLGPFIVALTPHAALAAPYHRIDRAIVTAQQIFMSPPAKAESLLRQTGADYLVACLAAPVEGHAAASETDAVEGSLRARLAAGEPIAFLEEIAAASPAQSLRVWRLR